MDPYSSNAIILEIFYKSMAKILTLSMTLQTGTPSLHSPLYDIHLKGDFSHISYLPNSCSNKMLRAEITLTPFPLRIISTYENKVKVDSRDGTSRKFRKYLLDKYDVISFPNFANMILHEGEVKNCSNTFCNIDNHIR